MPDSIRLLPDSIANQIAAGEVVQRPSSVVKELLENALDAGADDVSITFRDGGQTLIEVSDNGRGMSDVDARMAWERHATSKIEKAEDLFHLNTFGFRGEALASIAAVAQVQMRTKREQDDVGTTIIIEASEVKSQEPSASNRGTMISVKNLFYNIPARRKFLKSVSVETKHIVEEFEKIALANPDVKMALYNGDKEVYNFNKGTLRQRVEQVLPKTRSGEYVEIEENTDIIGIHGFIGSPERSRRTRGDQYFYVNGRYIRSPYFMHAVSNAYEGLIEKDHYPSFVLFLETDPEKIDVNVHPMKTEIKFEEGTAIYSIIKAVVKRGLGSYHQTPDLDDSLLHRKLSETGIPTIKLPESPRIKVDKGFNPFGGGEKKRVPTEWEKLYEPFRVDENQPQPDLEPDIFSPGTFSADPTKFDCIAINRQFFAATAGGELYVVNVKRARERVFYDQYKAMREDQRIGSQQLLFPRTVEFSASDFQILESALDDINAMGFDIRHFGKNTVIINGTPGDLPKGDERQMLEQILIDFKDNSQELKLEKRESLMRSLARNASLKKEESLSSTEMNELMSALLNSNEPGITPGGKSVMAKFQGEDLIALLRN